MEVSKVRKRLQRRFDKNNQSYIEEVSLEVSKVRKRATRRFDKNNLSYMEETGTSCLTNL